MKNKIKKLIYIAFCATYLVFVAACTNNANSAKMINPWSDCNDNLLQASKIAGFKFPLVLSNFTVRAMKEMIEITYPIDENRDVTVRKSSFEGNDGDISGDYNVYSVNKQTTFPNGVEIKVRGTEKLIYVANFAAEQGYYSISCDKGMTLYEVYRVYKIIAEAEAPRFDENIKD